jgi:hypothetical protein
MTKFLVKINLKLKLKYNKLHNVVLAYLSNLSPTTNSSYLLTETTLYHLLFPAFVIIDTSLLLHTLFFFAFCF